MKLLRRFLIIMALIMLPIAAAGVYLFKTLDTRNKMNSSQVNCILKDSKGYMWFGTPAGLYRYDGYVYRNFQCDSQDGSSLPDSYIYDIQEAMDGTLWINTAQGMCVYHPRTETFERDMHQVYTKMGVKGDPAIVYIDKDKNLWMYIPKRGVLAYNMQKQLMYEFGYTDGLSGIPEGDICSFSECADGVIITYDNGRLVCVGIENDGQKKWQTNTIANQNLRHTGSLKSFADARDNIWLYGHGTLMLYLKSKDEWITSVGDNLGLTGSGVDRTVFSMSSDRQGNIWMATDRSGLVKMKAGNYEMEFVTPVGINVVRRGGEDVVSTLCTYVDDTGLLWVGTEKNGVAFYGKNIYKFQSALIGDVTAITEDIDGKMWYGTSENGIYGYDGPLASRKVSALATTSDGSLWVGSRQNGITRIVNGESIFYSLAKDSTKTLIDDHINAMTVDKTGNLWIATNGGLQMYSTKMNTFSSYTRENKRLTTNTITCLAYGSGNTLFAGTNEGVLVLNISTTEKEILTGEKKSLNKFTNNYITQVLEDSRGLLWVGTRDGINVYDRSNDRLVYITEKDGLCNNCVRGLTEDGNHNVWISTTNGVCRVVVQRNHEDGTFNYSMYNYDTSDGMQGNEFNQGAVFTKKDGNVVLGGIYGINWATKQGKDSGESLQKVMLTQLYIGDTEILPGHIYDGSTVLPEALNETNKIVLANSQNTFTIKFAGGNYNQSERLMFMYWMEGRDLTWRNGDALNHGVTFTDLGSGSYKLHVKAISASGAVSDQERILEIVIERPWWLQWWMMIIYALVILGGVYLWRFGLKEARYVWNKKKQVLAELMRQRREIKTASDNLAQPMSRMTSIIGNLAETTTTIEGKEQLNSLHFQMLQVITQISEMQMALDDPESKANDTAESRLQLNDRGYVNALPKDVGEVLTSEFTHHKLVDSDKLRSITMIFIDDNADFQKFIMSYLSDVYDLHVYGSAAEARKDIDVLHPRIIVCKQELSKTTGSDLCNSLKTNAATAGIKFVLMTDGVLSRADMQDMNITLSADDYLAKPFNLQEAIMRFNRLLGIEDTKLISATIEGGETRRLENYNASMTTATLTFGNDSAVWGDSSENDGGDRCGQDDADGDRDSMHDEAHNSGASGDSADLMLISGVSNMSAHDQQLLYNIDQYVLHNMSNGHLNIEAMAQAMGMGRVQFFRKIQALVGKTPTELILDMRLKHACILLEKTDISMSELAINVGLNTADNFITLFKEKYDMSPLVYRMNSRKK